MSEYCCSLSIVTVPETMPGLEVGFKVCNAGLISGLFIFYICNEEYPGLCLQALTYQVRLELN